MTTFTQNNQVKKAGSFLSKAAPMVLMGGLAYLNAKPYVAAATAVLKGSISEDPWFQAVYRLPDVIGSLPYIGPPIEAALDFVGGLIAAVGTVGGAALGLTAWGLIQAAQLLPIALFRDNNRLESVIRGVEADTKRTGYDTENDTGILKSLKDLANSLPLIWIEQVYMWANIAFLVDFLACSIYYPVLRVNVQEFIFTRGVEQVIWTNAATTAICVFGFWVLFNIFLSIAEGSRYIGDNRP